MTKLWDPITVGRMKLPHRMALAPMARMRALHDGTPDVLTPEYYAQRASLGLVISEATQPSDAGQAYPLTPGIYTDAHVKSWKKVAERVHEAGGYLFIQVLHAGRTSHPDNTLHHGLPVAPSAIAPNSLIHTPIGKKIIPVPREMSHDDIQSTIADFRKAAAMAIKAGADGVEIHGANGYLIHQFISENANQRKDEYGGSIENRARFAIEIAAAVADEIGSDRTGFRISPGNPAGNLIEGHKGPDIYRHLTLELAKLNLAYLHVLQGGNEELLRDIRASWPTALLVNRPGRQREDIAIDIDAGLADIAPIGRWAIANPDFVERLRIGAPLNVADPFTIYGGDHRGYTDYPRFNEKN